MFYHNEAVDAGGISAFEPGLADIRNCTIVDNTAHRLGGGLLVDGPGAAVVTNSIFWDNVDGHSDTVELEQINVPFGGESPDASDFPEVTYTDVQGLDVLDIVGAHNIDEDPLFVNATLANFRLESNSPCIDLADDGALPVDAGDIDEDVNASETLPRDLRRFARQAAIVDMGAYEWQDNCTLADVDEDGDVDLADLGGLLTCYDVTPVPGVCARYDFDEDGEVGLADLGLLLQVFDACGSEGLLPSGNEVHPPDVENWLAWAQQASVEELQAWYAEWLAEQ